MDLKLNDRVAIVTGAASGMGAASVRLLAREGAVVVPCDRDATGVGDVAASLAVQPVVFDVSEASACAEAIEETLRRHGRLDILVNAAGIIVRSEAWETTDEDWDRIFDVNVNGPFYMSRAAVPAMRAGDGGSIVNFGSIWGSVGAAGTAAYTASKGAVHQLTRSMALEHAREGIRVNAVCPGEIDTPMLSSARARPVSRAFLDDLAHATVPTGTLGQPEDVARVVAFLASDASSYMTGSLVTVDAGFTAR